MTPETLCKSGSEHGHQMALFCAIARDYPLTAFHPLHMLYAIHNKGHGDKIRGGQAKAEGVKAGVPDLCLPVPVMRRREHAGFEADWKGAYLELKIPSLQTHKNGGASPEQVKWIKALRANGYYATLGHGWEDAYFTLRNYLAGNPPAEFELVA